MLICSNLYTAATSSAVACASPTTGAETVWRRRMPWATEVESAGSICGRPANLQGGVQRLLLFVLALLPLALPLFSILAKCCLDRFKSRAPPLLLIGHLLIEHLLIEHLLSVLHCRQTLRQ